MALKKGVMKVYFMESFDGTKLYTEVFLPDERGKYPVICIRNPYVQKPTGTEEERNAKLSEQAFRLDEGFAVVHQHCRGYGASDGRVSPFTYERRDGLALLDWIQKQEWYKDGIYLDGASYTAYVHFAVLDDAPQAVKGASLGIYTSHAYSAAYLNGEYKMRIGPLWYPSVLRNEEALCSVENSFDVKNVQQFFRTAICQYPFYQFPKRLYGHDVPELSDWFFMNGEDDEFARRKNGVGDAYGVMKRLKIPVLLKGGWFDPFFGGMVPMWEEIPEETRKHCAFLVGPWTHSTTLRNVEKCPFIQEQGEIEANTALEWFLHLRDGKPFRYAENGRITAYVVGEGKWISQKRFTADEAKPFRLYPSSDSKLMAAPPDETQLSYRYNPYDPPEFVGGQNTFYTESDGAALQREMNFRPDVKSFVTEAFDDTVRMRGRTKVRFSVKSDCEDTAFLARISAVTESGEAWILQETITTLSHAVGAYDPGETVEFIVETEPLYWTINKGERIRVDIASANALSYWPHSNTKGHWAVQDHAQIAANTLMLGRIYLEFPTVSEEEEE